VPLRVITALLLLAGFFCIEEAQSQSITVNSDLVFGDVFPGIPKQISRYTPGAAAEFLITGTAGAEVTLDFTLPTYMNSNGWNMQLIFRDDDCAMDSSATPDQTNPGYDDIDPWHTITYRLGSAGLTVWLGGTAVPKLAQRKGGYTASIVLTVAYTGN
jgi:hypothetical protein